MYSSSSSDPPGFTADPVVGAMCEEMNGVFDCTADPGASVTLPCKPDGNPSPVVTFVPPTAPVSENNIVFSSVTMENTGNYTCTVSVAGFTDAVRRFQLVVGAVSYTHLTLPTIYSV